MPNPPQAALVLDREFLEMRANLVALAAALDRIGRAAGSTDDDARRQKIDRALRILTDTEPTQADRAEQIQLLFSRTYDPDWRQTLSVAKG